MRKHAITVAVAVLTVVVPTILFAFGSFILGFVQDHYSRAQLSAYVVKLDNPEPHLLSNARAVMTIAADELDELLEGLDSVSAVGPTVLRNMLREEEKLMSDVPRELAHIRLVNNTDRTLNDVAIMPATDTLSYLGGGATAVYDSDWQVVGQEQLNKLVIAPRSSIDFILLGDRSYRLPDLAKVTLGGAEIDPITIDLDVLSSRLDYFWEVSAINWTIYFLAAMGAVMMVLIALSAPISAIASLRRRLTSKEEFERMHSDVKALYSRYRPGETNPLEPQVL
jgi:hypothetical protein